MPRRKRVQLPARQKIYFCQKTGELGFGDLPLTDEGRCKFCGEKP